MLGWLIYRFLWYVLNGLRRIGVLRIRVEGLEHLPRDGGVVLVSNHVHWLDIPIQGTVLPPNRRGYWLAKAELFEGWFGYHFMHTMGAIPVRRGKNDTQALDAAVAELRAGKVVVIYPEGTRSRSGILQKGKPGALVLAAQSGCPILPMTFVGTEHGFGMLRGKPVTVRFGQPFHVPALPTERASLRAVSAQTTAMMQHLAALLPPERRGFYAEKNQELVEHQGTKEPGNQGTKEQENQAIEDSHAVQD